MFFLDEYIDTKITANKEFIEFLQDVAKCTIRLTDWNDSEGNISGYEYDGSPEILKLATQIFEETGSQHTWVNISCLDGNVFHITGRNVNKRGLAAIFQHALQKFDLDIAINFIWTQGFESGGDRDEEIRASGREPGGFVIVTRNGVHIESFFDVIQNKLNEMCPETPYSGNSIVLRMQEMRQQKEAESENLPTP